MSEEIKSIPVVELIEKYARLNKCQSQPDRNRLNKLIEFFNQWYPGLLTTDLKLETIEEMREMIIDKGYEKGGHRKYGHITVNKFMRCLKSVLIWGADRDYFRYEELNKLKFKNLKINDNHPGTEKKLPHRNLTPQERKALFKFLPPTYRDIGRLMIITGMRTGEVAQIQRKEVNFETCRYCPEHHKTAYCGKDRIIVLPPTAMTILEKYQDEPNYFFTPRGILCRRFGWDRNTPRGVNKRLDNCKNEHVAVASIDRAFQTAGDRAIKAGELDQSLSPYFLRHSAVTDWAIAGFSEKEIQELAGHTNIKTQRIYDHSSPTVLNIAAQKLIKLNRID